MGTPVAEALARVVGVGAPVAFTAYDGSKAGPSDAEVTVHIRSVDALRYAVTAPGELGLARAYVSGHLEFDGDTHTLLRLVARQNVAEALASLIQDGYLGESAALDIGRALFHDNPAALYNLADYLPASR